MGWYVSVFIFSVISSILFLAAYAEKVKGMLVTELNAGQMVEDVRLAVNGKVKVEHFGRLGGIVPDPDEIVAALKEKLL